MEEDFKTKNVKLLVLTVSSIIITTSFPLLETNHLLHCCKT